MSEAYPVLDHGFIRVIESMGEDSSVVQAARVSYGEGTTTKRGDARLIRYLMRNAHMTPFEMCELKVHVKAPIFVARQWMRHRTASVNEYSGRYSVMSEDFYVPSIDQIQYQSESDKQGREGVMSEADAANWKYAMENTSRVTYNVYNGSRCSMLACHENSHVSSYQSTFTQSGTGRSTFVTYCTLFN